MRSFAIIVLLCAAALAQAGTFELSDPANEMLQEEEQQLDASQAARDEPAASPVKLGDSLCTVDTSSGACSCIDKKMARKMSLSQEQCAAQVLRALKLQ